jgi:serine/threonine protein kinase
VAEEAGAKLIVGELIAGRYRMVAPIAQGGMGSVWKAHDERAFGQPVAIKVVRAVSVSDAVKQRFVEEAKVISTLNSPHIVGLREFGTTASNYPFFVMDLLEGQTVTERLFSEGACSERDGARILDGLLAGLQELHLQGVIHRDLKPSNVFLEQSSAIDAHVRILDLGIAQLVDGGDSPKGRQKRVVGTPRWMAPEVLLGDPASQVSDLYSVGLLGVLILGGEIPHSKFSREGAVLPFDRSCIIQRLGNNSVKVAGRRGMEPISDAFCHVLEEALWRSPEDRYADALEFRIALRKALPHLGMPNLPFANAGRSSRNVSVPVEHTLLENDAAAALGDMKLGGTLTKEMLAQVDDVEQPAHGGGSRDSDARGVSEQEVQAAKSVNFTKTLIESASEDSEQQPPSTQRMKWSPLLVISFAVFGGLVLGWFFLSSNDQVLELDKGTTRTDLPVMLPTSSSKERRPDGGQPFKVVVRDKLVIDAGLIESPVDVGANVGRDATRAKAKFERRKSTVRRKPKTISKSAGAGKLRRSKPNVDSLGKRCRVQFREIVRDSEGGSLVQSSPLCERIGMLSKEATKPKCGLSSNQRKELTLLEVLCESNP